MNALFRHFFYYCIISYVMGVDLYSVTSYVLVKLELEKLLINIFHYFAELFPCYYYLKMNRFWLFSAKNVFDFGILPKIYSAYSCLWSKSIPTCWRWCWESKTPPCENGQNLQSLVSFHMIYVSDLLPTGNIRSYDSSHKLAANSQCIWYFVLTFKYSYCLTGFSKIYWWILRQVVANVRGMTWLTTFHAKLEVRVEILDTWGCSIKNGKSLWMLLMSYWWVLQILSKQ